MSRFSRRSVIATGSAIVTSGVFATVGTGNASDTDASTETKTTDADVPADPSDGWVSFRANAGSTRSVSAANEPDAPGGVVWRYDDVDVRDGIAISDGRVYRHDGTGRIRALDAADGSLEWTSEDIGVDDAPNSAPVVAGDWIYVGGEALTALDAATGAVRWTQEFGGSDESPTVYQPEYAFGTIYVATDDDSLYAVDPTDGSIRWQRSSIDEIDEGDSLVGRYDTFHAYSLAVTSNAVYATVGVPGDAIQVVALDLETGETLWTADPDGTLRARVAATEKHVFVYDSALHETRVVDATTGEIVEPISGGGPASISDGVFVGVTVGDERELRATDLETVSNCGRTRWVHDEARAYGSPVSVGDTVVVVIAADDGNEYLVGFDRRNGREKWRLHLDEVPQLFDGHSNLRYELAITDGTIYLSADDVQFAIR